MSLRPILKGVGPQDYSESNPFPFSSCHTLHHVHFPPSPALSSTHEAHSSAIYDRAPIVVAPNNCALPRRGDRVYTDRRRVHHHCEREQVRIVSLCTEDISQEASESDCLDPLALSLLSLSLYPPPLVPDTSSSSSSSSYSSSDDFDDAGLSSRVYLHDILNASAPGGVFPIPFMPDVDAPSHPPIPGKQSQEDMDNALSFLPYYATSSDGRRPHAGGRCVGSVGPRRARNTMGVEVAGASTFAAPSLDGCLGGF
jgi:hypothetical protein